MSRGEVTERPERDVLLILIVVVVVSVDQLTKFAVKLFFESHPAKIGPLTLRVIYNEGTAFGLGRGWAPVLIAIGTGALVAISFMLKPTRTRMGRIALGMVLGGAIGNLLDRLFRSHNGAVVDFIDFRWWPTFNLADVAIVSGVMVFVFMGRKNQVLDESIGE